MLPVREEIRIAIRELAIILVARGRFLGSPAALRYPQ
jgi:hypothetical protein